MDRDDVCEAGVIGGDLPFASLTVTLCGSRVEDDVFPNTAASADTFGKSNGSLLMLLLLRVCAGSGSPITRELISCTSLFLS